MTIDYQYDLIQGTDQWLNARLGLLTASTMKQVITPTLKIANNEKTRAHLYEIVAQRAAQYAEPQYESYDMMRGKTEEVYAAQLYSEHHAQVKDCGFITNDKWGFKLGYSPDGVVGKDGLIEIKSRNQKYQIQTIINDEVPKEFMMQIQAGLMISERKWCDFISFSNGLPMFIQRVFPDEEIQEAIYEAANAFEISLLAGLSMYKDNASKFIETDRRDYDTGDTITPSDNASSEPMHMAG